MYNRRTMLRTGGVALAGLVAGCGGSSDGGTRTGTPSKHHVDMTDGLNFEPQELTVSAGGTVVWETTGSVAHSVTAYKDDLPDGAAYFASGDFGGESAARESYPAEGSVGPGETFSHTFETVGEHPYFCIPHESGMRGTVIVE
ncbi:plastocyanin [Haloarcula sp. CBA1130]|uniref:plastocyanin/azurin family copper-binding protein n=1 Tax=unclassified Haloarcula TaxID=2624677 RepID=UPI001243A08B|nr:MULTISPECIES: plastocyanin/azurin family copper-binding protein [unclassified Haloarcula]KAA9396483.1 plastocyanin [Haloarcula sp. CBA1130]KAA9397660.1 plastocyanin [Haloarcula sp. CBA1129]